jgi:hypothetical protein
MCSCKRRSYIVGSLFSLDIDFLKVVESYGTTTYIRAHVKDSAIITPQTMSLITKCKDINSVTINSTFLCKAIKNIINNISCSKNVSIVVISLQTMPH